MASTSAAVLARLNRVLGSMDDVLAGTLSGRSRAERLAGLVAALDERCAGGLCRLHCGDECLLAACDAQGQATSAWETVLARDVDWQAPPGWRHLAAPAALALPRHHLAIMCDADVALALLLPETVENDEVRELLATAFARVKLHHAANQRDRLSTLLAEEIKKGDVAESAAVFHHELGNILNNLVLDADALARENQGAASERILDIKASVAAFAQQMSAFVQYQHSRRTPAYPVGLTAIVKECAAGLAAAEPDIRLELAEDLPAVLGTISDLQRLVRLLLSNAVAAADGAVVVRGERRGAVVLLSFAVPAKELSAEEWRRVFQPFADVRDGLNGMELAVCRALLRRFQGKLRGESPPAGGILFTCELATEGA